MGMKSTAPYFSTLDRAGVTPDSTIITRAEAPSLLPRDYLLSRQIGAVNGIDIMLPPDHPLRQLGVVDRITATIDADSQDATTCTPPNDQSRCEICVYASDGSHRNRIALELDRSTYEAPLKADQTTTRVLYLDQAANVGILSLSNDQVADDGQPIGVRVTDYATAQAQLDTQSVSRETR